MEVERVEQYESEEHRIWEWWERMSAFRWLATAKKKRL